MTDAYAAIRSVFVGLDAAEAYAECGKSFSQLAAAAADLKEAGAAGAEGALAGIAAAATAALGPVAALLAALGAAWAYYNFLKSHQAYASGHGLVQPKKGGTIYAIGGGRVSGMNYPGAQEAAAATLGVSIVPLPHGVGSMRAGGRNIGPPPSIPHFSAFGTPPAFTSGLGGGGSGSGVPTIGTASTTQAQIAAHFKTLASTLNNTGVQAKKYLESERAALQQELKDLPAASGKHAAAVRAAAARINDQLITVNQQIKDALNKTGAALIPAGLRQKLASQTAQFSADSAYQQSLTGKAADDYRQTLLADLTGERTTLQREINNLKSRLAGADAKQRANITAELAKLQTQMSSLNQSIISQIESNINALQSQLGTVFNSVQSEMDTALGNLYFQNGLLTPSEALLKSMQSADQLNSLNDSLAQAQQTLANDQSGLAKRVLDVATGKITNVYDPQNAARIAQDRTAVAQAQRAIDEYNLQLKATQERTQADQTYTAQVAKLNAQLAQWEVNALNGTATMGQLRDIAASFGIQINTDTVPDFNSLQGATLGLAAAFQDLIAYIKTLTGKTPSGSQGTIYDPGTGNTTTPQGVTIPPTVSYNGVTGPSIFAFKALGGVSKAANGLVATGPMFNARSRTIFGEAGDEAYLPLDNPTAVKKIRKALATGGEGVVVNVNVSGDVVGMTPEEFARRMTPTVRQELILLGQRNGGTTHGRFGTK